MASMSNFEILLTWKQMDIGERGAERNPLPFFAQIVMKTTSGNFWNLIKHPTTHV